MVILPLLMGMFFVLAAVLLFILLFVFLGGLAMFIVGLVTKIRAKSQNRKKIYPNVLLGLSIPIMILPVLIFTVAALDFYNQVINKQSDEVVFNEKLEEFFDAADSSDSQAIYDLFSKSAQDSDLKQQIDDFLKVYPTNPDIEYVDGVGSADSFGDEHYEILESLFVFSKDGEDYYCYMVYTSRYDSDEDEVGINSFTVESPEVYCDESFEFPDDNGLYINISDDYDYETVRIEGYPRIFTSYDRIITEEQVTEFLKSNVDFADFKDKFGEPNVEDVGYYYELQSVNGEKRFLEIFAYDYNDSISSATIVDDVGEYFDKILDEDTASEIWEKNLNA